MKEKKGDTLELGDGHGEKRGLLGNDKRNPIRKKDPPFAQRTERSEDF